MKKIFTFIVLFVVSLYSMAQTPFFYEWKNGYCTRRYLSDVDSITFDSDSTTYDRLSGAWKMEVVSDNYNGLFAFEVTVHTDEQGGPAYGKYCVVTGLSGYSFMAARLDYHFDESTGEGYVAFPMPYVSVERVNFGSFVGDIHLYGLSEDNQLYSSAEIRGIWNDDMSEITFEAAPKMGMVVVVDGQLYGWWDRFVVVKMVKTKKKYNTMNLALSGGNVCSDNSVAITPNEVITTSIKRAETAFMDSSVNNWRPDTFEVISKVNAKNETKDDAATVNMDKERRTSKAVPQSQYFYEWNNGRWFQRSLVEVDSITFSLPDSSTATCKGVGEAPDGKCFVVSGTITKIANTTYGNWYMTDGTAELYIYGTLDAEGKTKNFLSLGLEVGDKVTIEGPKGSYKGEPQMVDVTVKKIEKALLKVVTAPVEISSEGGVLEVKLASKGKGAFYEISEDCQEWISYEKAKYISGEASMLEPNPADTIVYTFNIAPNDASARTGEIKFFTNDGAPIPYTFSQAGVITDVTVAEFLAASVNNAAQYRIVGHVTGFHTYNNNFFLKDYTGEVYAYYVNTQGVENIAIGDFVTVVGTRSEYHGTPQLPKGTLLEKYTASPEVTVAEFLTKEDSKEVYYKLTGTITEIKNAQHGIFYLQDANGDIVYVYGLLPGYGATGADKQGLVEAKGLKVGDTLTIVGNKASYKGDHQVGNAVYMSHTSY